jgi:hypothetical protein
MVRALKAEEKKRHSGDEFLNAVGNPVIRVKEREHMQVM